MKSLYVWGISICFFTACQNQSADKKVNQAPDPKEKAEVLKSELPKAVEQQALEVAFKTVENDQKTTTGFWVGNFGEDKLNLIITEFDGKTLKGFSVCAGNYRPVVGEVSGDGALYQLKVNEPGDDKYDGLFKGTLDMQKQEIVGTWSPFKTGITDAKNYTLKPVRNWQYNPSVGDNPEASQRLLTKEDVENEPPDYLAYIRNEIYARHGYSFKTKEMRAVFSDKDWYVPHNIDVRDMLTDIEIKNIALLKKYEKYNVDWYDKYGR